MDGQILERLEDLEKRIIECEKYQQFLFKLSEKNYYDLTTYGTEKKGFNNIK